MPWINEETKVIHRSGGCAPDHATFVSPTSLEAKRYEENEEYDYCGTCKLWRDN